MLRAIGRDGLLQGGTQTDRGGHVERGSRCEVAAGQEQEYGAAAVAQRPLVRHGRPRPLGFMAASSCIR